MILALNIGNSRIMIGGFQEKEILFTAELLSDARRTKDQYAADLKSLMQLKGAEDVIPTGAIISSVVPELTSCIKDAIAELFAIQAMVVGPGIKSGLNLKIENPAQLGADIVAGAVAVSEITSEPAIICNLGTATVMGILGGAKNFLGVVIAAGVDTTLDGFTKRTALLPHVNIDVPKNVIGKNTIQSVQSGLIFGTASMIDGLVRRIEEEAGQKMRIFATGKACDEVIPYCKTNIEVEEHLILEGLRVIYEKNC